MSFHRRRISMDWLRRMANSDKSAFDRIMMSEASIFAEDGSFEIWNEYRSSNEERKGKIQEELRNAKTNSVS